MPSVQVTLVANTPTAVNLPSFSGRVVATMISAPGETYITADGTGPVTPVNNTIATGTQAYLPGVTGAQTVVQPPLQPFPLKTPQIQLMSAGTPVIELSW